jgi:predicted ATPase
MTERSPSPLRSPLVGRDHELERVHAALDDVLGGSGRVVLISGEPGMGKTRLAEEVAAHAADRGAFVAWGRLDDAGGGPPYWPWIGLLQCVLDGIDADVARGALGDHAGAIAAILPRVADLVADIAPPPPLAPAAARFRLHEAIVCFLRRVAEQRPLAIVLEDLDYADVSSLKLTRCVASRLSGAAVLLVLTYRTLDGDSVELLDDMLGSLARQPAVERAELEGLSEPEVGVVIAQTIGLRPRRATVAAVHARTAGNPFFVAELALLLRSEGLMGATGTAYDVAAPVGVRDVVRRRVERLPPATVELLALAAAVGREFAVALLADSTAARELDVAQAIEPAIAAGLVLESAAAHERLRFSHALIRDTLYCDLGARRCATLHARVGAALERRGVDDGSLLYELARHFFHAAAVVGPDRGLAYSLKAAQAAEATLAYERAEDDLRRALRLVALIASQDERIVQELRVQNSLAALLTITPGHARRSDERAVTASELQP